MMKRTICLMYLWAFALLIIAACDNPFNPGIMTATTTPQGTVTTLAYSLRTPIPLPSPDIPLPQTPPSIETIESLGPLSVSGRIEQPQSRRVQKGQHYNYVLYTHCGIDNNVDFDGSFWVARGDSAIQFYGTAEPVINNLTEIGTLILLDDDHARFEFDKGFIDYTRHVGPKIVIGCE